MARKNMGKVKRYRRSFYSGGQQLRRILTGVLALAVLFAAGWLIGPAVIDFGTSTWYSMKQGGESSGTSSGTSQPASESQAAPEPTPEPQPTAAPAVEPGQGSWAFVSISGLSSAEQAAATAQNLASQGVGYAVVPCKDSQGYVYYQSSVATAQSSVSATTFDAAAVQALKDAGITPIASICAFRDPLAPYVDRSMAVRYQNTDYFWLDAAADAGGKPWLNPYSDGAVNYITALIDEVRAMGFEQVWLTGVQFPTTAGRDKANYGDTAGVSMGQRLTQVLSGWQAGGDCWVEYPLSEVLAGSDSQLLGASCAELGVKNLAIRADDALTEEQQLQLDAAVTELKAGGVANIALVQGDSLTLL